MAAADLLEIAPAWDTPAARAWCAALPATTAAAPAAAVIYRGRNTLWRLDGPDGPVVVKGFAADGNWWKRLTARLRTGKARRSFAIGRRLLALGVVTPEPLAAVEATTPTGRQTFYCCRYAAGASLRALLAPDAVDRPARIAAFAAWTALLHERGVLHRDFTAGNILLLPAQGGEAHALIDLNRIAFRRVGRWRGLWNLLQPGFTAPDDARLVVTTYWRARGGDDVRWALTAYRALTALNRWRWAIKRGTRPLRRRLGW